jgi:membrane fusion protein (multidrug efflux system)
MSTPADQAEERTSNGRRKLLIALVLLVFLAAGVAYAAWWLIAGRYQESTDDAYVGGNFVQVTPQVTGTVLAIRADDTDYVKSGQTLVELDKTDAKVALDQAEAQLAKTVRSVRNLESTSTGLDASVSVRRAELAKAEQDFARRRAVEPTGAVSAEELQHARDAVAGARAALDAALRQAEAQRALVDRTSLKSHPDVQSAAARVREAYLGYARTSLPAPVSGYVARRSVQVGQRVNAGTPLMTVVPLDQVWVDANFKEGQLAHLRTGQPVKLTADAYGSSVEYHGRVAGFGAGTGSSFALLPAQNATGNWIKVVQRVPVRIVIDPKEVEQHPLQIGLSMQVEVDTHQREGQRLQKAPRAHAGYETLAFSSVDELAEQRVAAIIAANSAAQPLAWTRKR